MISPQGFWGSFHQRQRGQRGRAEWRPGAPECWLTSRPRPPAPRLGSGMGTGPSSHPASDCRGNHRRQRQQRAGHRMACQEGTGTRGFQKRCKIQLSALAALLPLPSTAQSGIPSRAAAWYPRWIRAGLGLGVWKLHILRFSIPTHHLHPARSRAEASLPQHRPWLPLLAADILSLSPIRAPSTSFGSSPGPHILPAFSPVPAESLPLPEHPKIPVSLQRNIISASAAACFSFPRMAKPPSQEEGVQ